MIFRYELDNGQIFSEAGALKDDGTQVVQGAYSFVGDDGQTYWVNYTADEEGFHPIVGKFIILFDINGIANLKIVMLIKTSFTKMTRFWTWRHWCWSRC